jgi:diguanylate cyclase
MNDVDLQQSVAEAQRALKLIVDHGLRPSPHTYELWLAYAGGRQADVVRAIEARLAGGGITDQDCIDLHAKFFSQSAAEKAVMALGDVVNAEIENVQNILATASRDTSSYGNTLQGVSGQLAKNHDPALLKVVIDNLVQATRTMATRSQRLENRLEQSKAEVSRLQENIETARAEARTDQLTKLSNRKAFDEAFRRAFESAHENNEPLCLLMGDIDHFKKFNDTWGHQTGDQVLRLVAHCMRESVRESDVPARYGGEEFAVILPTATLEIAAQIAERIRWNVESKRMVKRSTGEDLGTITMSLGVAMLNPKEDGQDLVKRADACLYAAKRAGRNRVTTERQVEGTPLAHVYEERSAKTARA